MGRLRRGASGRASGRAPLRLLMGSSRGRAVAGVKTAAPRRRAQRAGCPWGASGWAARAAADGGMPLVNVTRFERRSPMRLLDLCRRSGDDWLGYASERLETSHPHLCASGARGLRVPVLAVCEFGASHCRIRRIRFRNQLKANLSPARVLARRRRASRAPSDHSAHATQPHMASSSSSDSSSSESSGAKKRRRKEKKARRPARRVPLGAFDARRGGGTTISRIGAARRQIAAPSRAGSPSAPCSSRDESLGGAALTDRAAPPPERIVRRRRPGGSRGDAVRGRSRGDPPP